MTTPTYAVGLRFGCASALLFVWLGICEELISLSIGIQSLTALSGLCSYGISYVLTYITEQTIPSGLVAITFTLMVFLTPALARLTYRTPTTRRTWIGGSLGVLAVVLCFLPDVSSIGAVCTMRLNVQNVPVVAYTAWVMPYGAAAALIYGALSGQSLHLDARPSFLACVRLFDVARNHCHFLELSHAVEARGLGAHDVHLGDGADCRGDCSILWEGLRPQALTWFGIVVSLAGAWMTLKSEET